MQTNPETFRLSLESTRIQTPIHMPRKSLPQEKSFQKRKLKSFRTQPLPLSPIQSPLQKGKAVHLSNSNLYDNDIKYEITKWLHLNPPEEEDFNLYYDKAILPSFSVLISLICNIYSLCSKASLYSYLTKTWTTILTISSLLLRKSVVFKQRTTFTLQRWGIIFDYVIAMVQLYTTCGAGPRPFLFHFTQIITLWFTIILNTSVTASSVASITNLILYKALTEQSIQSMMFPAIQTVSLILINYNRRKSLLELWVWFDSFKSSYQSMINYCIEQEGIPTFHLTKKFAVLNQSISAECFLNTLQRVQERGDTLQSYLLNEDVFNRQIQSKVNQCFPFPFLTKQSHFKGNAAVNISRISNIALPNSPWFSNCHTEHFKWMDVRVFSSQWRGNDCYGVQWTPNTIMEFTNKWYRVQHEITERWSECIEDIESCINKKITGWSPDHLKLPMSIPPLAHLVRVDIPYELWFHLDYKWHHIDSSYNILTLLFRCKINEFISRDNPLNLLEYEKYWQDMFYIPLKLNCFELLISYTNCNALVELNYAWFHAMMFSVLYTILINAGKPLQYRRINITYETVRKGEDTAAMRVTIEYFDTNSKINLNEINQIINNDLPRESGEDPSSYLPFGFIDWCMCFKQVSWSLVTLNSQGKTHKIVFEMSARTPRNCENDVISHKSSIRKSSKFYDELSEKVYNFKKF